MSVPSSKQYRDASEKHSSPLSSRADIASASSISMKSQSVLIYMLIAITMMGGAIQLWLPTSSNPVQLNPSVHASTLLRKQPQPSQHMRIFMDPESNKAISGPFGSLQGPHINANFPDPCIIYHDGTTYAFATNNRKAGREHVNVQVATSTDNRTWNIQQGLDALPHVAPWQTGGAVWAPDIKHLPDGRFVLYYTDSLIHEPQTHCIGAAISDRVTGPYEPLLEPLICPHGGAIDPAGFFDHSTGKRYMIYKVDGNSLGNGGLCRNDVLPIKSTPLMLQEVDCTDGISLMGKPIRILDRDALDGPLIEAPAMYLSSEGIYFLFYSANCFTSPEYHTGYATATDIMGPYVKTSRPLLITGDHAGLTGPGGMDIIHHAYTSIGENMDWAANKNDSEGRMILFHGHMTVYNDPATRKKAKGNGKHKPVKNLHLDFVRGMYSGTAFFSNRSVSLRVDGFQN